MQCRQYHHKDYYVWEGKGRGQVELEREHRKKGFVPYFEAEGAQKDFFTGSMITCGFYKGSICRTMDNS